MRAILNLFSALLLAPLAALHAADASAKKPNVLLIVCDDLNDYVGALGGHPQARTPNIDRLFASGVSFTQAHSNIPLCAPARASLFTGLYPHTSQYFGIDNWDENAVLKNNRTVMDHFRANGYQTLGTGKVMHNRDRKEWQQYGHPADYGPFAKQGEQEVAHPDTPAPFRDDSGSIDGSFGPLKNLEGGGFSWITGGWEGKRTLRYVADDDRDPTHDELNARWAVEKLRELAAQPKSKPFFMGVGFVRPHTPLIVPQKYFDLFPLETLQLPEIKAGDKEDTFKHTVNTDGDDRGTKIHDSLVTSYGNDRELALKKFLQAYLACVASVDDLVGHILDALDASPFKERTIVVLTSDNGWQMGQKAYVYKNSLWQESTRIPLVIRAPGVAKAGGQCPRPVSHIDLYPTLVDLCGLPTDTRKNDQGRPLDGHSLKPLLTDPENGIWNGPDTALTALSKWAKTYDAAQQSYALRSRDWRYIRYENGKEELYHVAEDPHEWTNLAAKPEHAKQLQDLRGQLLAMIPKSTPATKPPAGRLQTSGTFSKTADGGLIFTDQAGGQVYYAIKELAGAVEPHLDKPVKIVANVKDSTKGKAKVMVYLISIQAGDAGNPETKAETMAPSAADKPAPQKSDVSRQSEAKTDAEAWKDKFFKQHPDADTNKDGVLSWPEYKTYKAKLDAKKAKNKPQP